MKLETPGYLPGNPPGATGFWKGTAEVTATLNGQTATTIAAFEA